MGKLQKILVTIFCLVLLALSISLFFVYNDARFGLHFVHIDEEISYGFIKTITIVSVVGYLFYALLRKPKNYFFIAQIFLLASFQTIPLLTRYLVTHESGLLALSWIINILSLILIVGAIIVLEILSIKVVRETKTRKYKYSK